ncbi:MAG: hypothetical protein ACRDFA_06980, partial [bacterium]
THLAFRRAWDRQKPDQLPLRLPLARTRSVVGALAVLSVFITTWWVPGLRVTVLAAGPWLLILALGYRLSRNRSEPLPSTSIAQP